MKIPYFHVDAFTNRIFGGNPAGVCFLEEWFDDFILQAIAAENNLSETAFLVGVEPLYDLRWFTPAVEVDLCGHGTLASAHAFFSAVNPGATEIRFNSQSGELTVTREDDLLILDFPTRTAEPCAEPAGLADALSARPVEVYAARDLLAVFENEEQVRGLTPDFAAIAKLDTFAVIATAPGDQSDFVSRFFAPRVGVPEDPVTGSAHCTLIPYWADRLNKKKLHALQVSKRGGELFCTDRGERVLIGGRAITYQATTIEF